MSGYDYSSLVESITSITGRMKLLPRWTQEGAIVGLEGGSIEVRDKVRQLVAANVSLAAVWLQDWVGIRSAFDGDRHSSFTIHTTTIPAPLRWCNFIDEIFM